ncbi:MAG TPA: dihydrodipicolinate synthase family protein [Candidatus Bathyarchaeia archaeon]|nr:dihydrodipicolinate synthase family protein [Candidatus Bathyarchaeia archaeon]
MVKGPKGVFCLACTPFDKHDQVNEKALRNNLRFLVEKSGGKDFTIISTGSIGEFYSLSSQEHRKVMEVTVDEVNGKLPVFCGTAQAGTKETVELCKHAQDIGADGVLVVLPYYHIPTEDGMYAHYETISRSIDLAIIVYNNPQVSKTWIRPNLMARLAKIDNIVADKENTPDISLYYQMKKAVDGTGLSVLCGLGELMFCFEALLECPGFASGFANFDPQIPLELYRAAASKDFLKIQEMLHNLAPFFAFRGKVQRSRTGTSVLGLHYEQHHAYIAINKEGMNIVGLDAGNVRAPLQPLTEEEKNELREVLKKIGVPSNR